MADTPEPPAYTQPYLARQPDGSTVTYLWHTDQQPTVDEVANFAASQGHQFAGFPEGPEAPPRPPAEAPSPQLSAAPPEAPPTLGQRAAGMFFPRRTLISETPSVGLAIPGAMYGVELGAPLGPGGMLVGGVTGAVLGGMGGEAVQYGAEQAIGLPPAEQGTFWQRVRSAGARTGAGELISYPARYGAQYVYRAVRPAAEAAQELRPILSGAVTGAIPPEGQAAHIALEPQAALARWYQENALGKSNAEIVHAWDALGSREAQANLAGEHLGAMDDYMATLRAGSTPWSETARGVMGEGGATPLGLYALWQGNPKLGGGLLLPAARDVGQEIGRKVLAAGLRSPRLGVPFLASLPPTAQVAGPLFGWGTRMVGQRVAAENWPPAAPVQ